MQMRGEERGDVQGAPQRRCQTDGSWTTGRQVASAVDGLPAAAAAPVGAARLQRDAGMRRQRPPTSGGAVVAQRRRTGQRQRRRRWRCGRPPGVPQADRSRQVNQFNSNYSN